MARKQKRNTFPIAFRLRKEVIERLDMLKEKHSNNNRTYVLSEIIMNFDFDEHNRLVKENRELKNRLKRASRILGVDLWN